MRMKHRDYRIFIPMLPLLALLFWSCTNLDETVFSAATPDKFYKTENELLAAVVPVYANLRSYLGDYRNLQEHSSDEMFVPQRGGDWGDGGIWRELQTHTWTPANPMINGAWVSAYTGIARANAVLENLKSSTSNSKSIPTFIAEVRTLRAFYYYWLMDLYGGVPIVTTPTTDPDNPPEQNTRSEVFDFVVNEIQDALPDLKNSFDAANYPRVTKGVAHAILAKVYLNGEVYTGTPHWSECVNECDNLINSGMYDLLPKYMDVFKLANEGPGNTENILVVAHHPESGVGFNLNMQQLHYNQLPQNPWNGFSTLSEFYETFDTTDARFNVFLQGPQYVLGGPNKGEPADDRQGNPLIFTEDAPLVGASEGAGIRVLKWEIDPEQTGGDAGNDFTIIRYSDILLMKAEALNEMNGPTQEAIDLINEVRARAFDPDKPLDLADYTTKQDLRDRILEERGYEFVWEGFRRQDQIRTEHFLEAWTLKDADTGEEYRKLFPIPQQQLDANPNIKQNPGY